MPSNTSDNTPAGTNFRAEFLQIHVSKTTKVAALETFLLDSSQTHRSAFTSFSRNSASKFVPGGMVCYHAPCTTCFPGRIVPSPSNCRNKQDGWYERGNTFFWQMGLVKATTPRYHWNTICAYNAIRAIPFVGHGITDRPELSFLSEIGFLGEAKRAQTENLSTF